MVMSSSVELTIQKDLILRTLSHMLSMVSLCHMNLSVCVFWCVHVQGCIYVCGCCGVYVYMSVCVCVCSGVCVCVYLLSYVSVYTYVLCCVPI